MPVLTYLFAKKELTHHEINVSATEMFFGGVDTVSLAIHPSIYYCYYHYYYHYYFYCKWLLDFNHKKTKVLIFQKYGRKPKHLSFTINNIPIEIVQECAYLGIR